MSVFSPVDPLISIGGAVLYTIGGLNPQRITHASEARFPAHAIPDGLAYQKTGLGERSKTIEARTMPHVMGGMDAFALLELHHARQDTVPFIRMSKNFLGLSDGYCVIQALEYDEDKLHPYDGVGRVIDVTLGLLMLTAPSVLSLAGLYRGGR